MKALYYNAQGEQTRTLEITTAVVNDLQTIDAIINRAKAWANADETMLRLAISPTSSSALIRV